MTVTRGISALREKNDEEFKSTGLGAKKFIRPGFFSLDDNETVVLRFVEEGYDWLGPNHHSFVKAKPKPAGWNGTWRESVSAICRYDDIIGADECYICDNKVENSWDKVSRPVRKIYTIAQVREAVYGDGTEDLGGPENKGKILFYVPKMLEVDETDSDGNLTGEKTAIPEFVIINQGLDAFAAPLEVHMNDFETLLDRDYRVTRVGTGPKTTYHFNPVPQGRDDDFLPGTDMWEEYVTQPLEKMGVDLLKDLQRKGSEEYYATYLDPTKQPPKRDGGGGNKPSGDSGGNNKSSANPTATPAGLAAAKDRLKKFKQR